MLSRENLKIAAAMVVCLLVGWTGPSVAHGVHAAFAHNADKVDGKHAVGAGASLANAKGKLVAHDNQGRLPDKFVGKPNQIVTTHGASGWTEHVSGSHTLSRWASRVVVNGPDGGYVVRTLDAPRQHGNARYGLQGIQVCYSTNGGAFIDAVEVYDSNPAGDILIENPTNRSSATFACPVITVGTRVTYGADLALNVDGGGNLTLLGVRAFWTRSSARIAPRAAARSGSAAG